MVSVKFIVCVTEPLVAVIVAVLVPVGVPPLVVVPPPEPAFEGVELLEPPPQAASAISDANASIARARLKRRRDEEKKRKSIAKSTPPETPAI